MKGGRDSNISTNTHQPITTILMELKLSNWNNFKGKIRDERKPNLNSDLMNDILVS